MTVPRRVNRLHGEEAGVGPTVLLLHAGGERRQVWTPVMDVLVAAGFRCVAYDQRDSDTLASYADDVAAMLDAEPPGCVVVGASLGGLAAMAALGATRVAGLVLVDVVPDLDPDRVRAFLAAGGLLDGHTAIVDDVLDQVPLLRRNVSELDVPLLLVRGGNGSPVTDEDADRLKTITPHATVARIPGAGHLVARDQPEALAEAITVTAEWPALALLRDLGAGHVDHPGGNLLDHLQRVRDLVADWGGSRRVQLAALCHATYGTDGFPYPLLPLEQRARLRAAIGDDAEALVYLYATYDRKKKTGEVVDLKADDLTDFALLTVANELDVARNAVLTPEERGGIRALITALAPYAPDATAVAVSDSSLL